MDYRWPIDIVGAEAKRHAPICCLSFWWKTLRFSALRGLWANSKDCVQIAKERRGTAHRKLDHYFGDFSNVCLAHSAVLYGDSLAYWRFPQVVTTEIKTSYPKPFHGHNLEDWVCLPYAINPNVKVDFVLQIFYSSIRKLF